MNNIKKTNWTINELNYLKDNYKNYTYSELSKTLNKSRSAIQHKVSRLGSSKSQYSNQKRSLNDSYFHIIDSEEQAYWLGFISADGTINNYHSGQYGFKLSLQESDSSFLKLFLHAISAEFDMKHTKTIRNGKTYKGCEVSFRSKEFVQDLLQYMTFNKTKRLNIPNIDSQYIRDYIRGFIDGDGCFYISKNNNKKKSFEMIAFDCSILCDIQNEFTKHGIVSNIYTKQNGNKKLGVYKNNSLIKLHHYLYDGATIFMQRKYDKSLKISKLAA